MEILPRIIESCITKNKFLCLPTKNINFHYFLLNCTIMPLYNGKLDNFLWGNFSNYDFNEASTVKLNSKVIKDAEKVFTEDWQLLQIGKQRVTKAGEHYVVPLPFGKESLEMPNNRKQAMKRHAFEVHAKPIIFCQLREVHAWLDHKRLYKKGQYKTT